MATLNNFHTDNGGARQEQFWFPRAQRLMGIQKNLHHPSAWDLPNLVPIGPVHMAQVPVLSGAHVDPQVTERRNRSLQEYFVPATPYTRMLQGDTADGRLLYQPPTASLRARLHALINPSKAPLQSTPVNAIY